MPANLLHRLHFSPTPRVDKSVRHGQARDPGRVLRKITRVEQKLEVPAHLAGELVGGERLAEPHLGVPQELGGLRAGVSPEVGGGLVDRGLLFGSRPEGLCARRLVGGA